MSVTAGGFNDNAAGIPTGDGILSAGGFPDAFAGNQGAILIEALKTPNYVAGVSGWTINRDGSAEFNNLSLRGTFSGTDYVINSSGEFFYSGVPALGDLAISLAIAAGNDSFTNPYIAGLVLYGPGNAKNVVGWNTTAGSKPLLGLFPDASWAYTNNSPFIQANDVNKGLASEFTSLQLGSGNPPAGVGSGLVLYCASPDGVTSIPHVSIYGGPTGILIADFNSTGLIAANPGTPNAGETWHAIPLSVWTNTGGAGNPTAQYKMLAQAKVVAVVGDITHAAVAGTSIISTALPPHTGQPLITPISVR